VAGPALNPTHRGSTASAGIRQGRGTERVVAVFDLDGTMTRTETLFRFFLFALGPARFLARLPAALPWLLGLALGRVARDRAKQAVIMRFLNGMPRAELEHQGGRFAGERLPALVRAGALERLAWHKARGHGCALASASLDVYVEPWARAAGFDEVFATSLEYAEGVATGRIAGGNCRAEEKVRRIEARYGDLSRLVLHGYGDSADDRHLLGRCAEAHYRPFRGAHDAPANPPAPRDAAVDYLRLLRPHQWVKNAFVFVGVLFGHAWSVPELLLAALLAAGAFACVASAIYIVNDYADRERDRLHPVKRMRPLAAGRVTPAKALVLAAALAVLGAGLAVEAGGLVLAIVAAYAAMNVLYSFGLKSQVILDVFIIAAGFLLRILAGTAGIGIQPSKWLLVCGLFLTLFLGFTKRRSEMHEAGGGADYLIHRKALLHYSAALLDNMLAITACAAIMSYSLYTMSPETIALHGTGNLIYTIPFVAYGMFRYLYLLHSRQAGTDTSRDLVRDPHLIVTVLAWAGVTAWLIA
jgi:HAD superfamily hydrolase (TIGR01490 family)